MPKLSAKDLELQELSALDVRERCRMAKLLQDELSKAPRNPKQGYTSSVIDEAAYRPQLNRLKLILSTMEFSPALHDLLRARTIALADEVIKTHTSQKLRTSWVKANERPEDALQKFVDAQCRIFGGPGSASFQPSAVDVKPVQWDIRGYFKAAAHHFNNKVIPPIVVNKDPLADETVQETYGLTFHEQLHSILWQLGLAAHHGAVPENHPLYNDAILMRERTKYGVGFEPYMPVAYNADPVEHACQHYEKMFMDRCKGVTADTGLSGSVRKFLSKVLPF